MVKNNSTIGISVRFYTNDLELNGQDGKTGKVCWDSGVVSIEANKEKGLKSEQEQFQNFEEMTNAIRKVLHKSKVLMVSDFRNNRIKTHH